MNTYIPRPINGIKADKINSISKLSVNICEMNLGNKSNPSNTKIIAVLLQIEIPINSRIDAIARIHANVGEIIITGVSILR